MPGVAGESWDESAEGEEEEQGGVDSDPYYVDEPAHGRNIAGVASGRRRHTTTMQQDMVVEAVTHRWTAHAVREQQDAVT